MLLFSSGIAMAQECDQIQAACDAKISQISSELQAAKTEREQFTTQVESLEKEKASLHASVAAANSELRSAQTEKETIQNTVGAEAESLRDASRGKDDMISSLQSKVASCSQAQQQAEAALSECSRQGANVKAELEAQASTLQAEAASLRAEVVRLKEAVQRAAAENVVTLPAVFAAVTKWTIKTTNCVVEHGKVIIAELQQGDTTHLAQLAANATAAARSASTHLYATSAGALDLHLPFVKARLAQAADKAGKLYNTHVANAAWTQEVKKHFHTANVELKALLTRQIQSHSSLGALNDPVYIQLIAYALILAPLMLLSLPLLLWVATLCTPSSRPAAGNGSKGKKSGAKGKAPASKAGGKRH